MNPRTPPTLPMPEPKAETPETEASGCASKPKAERLEPTRYGDWEMNGKCVDF